MKLAFPKSCIFLVVCVYNKFGTVNYLGFVHPIPATATVLHNAQIYAAKLSSLFWVMRGASLDIAISHVSVVSQFSVLFS